MPPVVRVGDLCTGHGCYPPRPAIEGSPNVFTNGIPTVRLNDAWAVHCCPPDCHSGVSIEGSPNVFTNGLPTVRVGDAISCGSRAAEGSPNVFANE